MKYVVALLSLFVLALAGCQSSAAPPADKPPPHRAGSASRDDVYFASDVPDDDQPEESGFSAYATRMGTSAGGFFSKVIDGPVKLYKRLNGDKPSDAARKMEDSASADGRRQGINELLEYDFAKREPYTKRYRQIAQADPEPTVRAVAIRASNRARDYSATSVFVTRLADKSELVRLEAAKALVHLPDPSATEPLLRVLNDREENRDVRIAAADALKHYRTLPVARALVSLLNDRDFGLSWQCRQTLRYLTRRDFRYDESAWLGYFTGPEKPFG